MFSIFNEMADTAGKMVGAVVAVPVALIAETLGVSVTLVKSAQKAGCETVEEIRDFLNDR